MVYGSSDVEENIFKFIAFKTLVIPYKMPEIFKLSLSAM